MAEITLPDGRTISQEDWDKIPPDMQKKAMTPGILKPPGPVKIGESNPSWPQDNANDPTMTQRLLMGGVGAIPGALAGGPIGAALGAAGGFMSPPQDAAEAGMAGLGTFMGGVGSKLEKMARAMPNKWMAKMLPAALGVTHEAGNMGIRAAVGNDNEPAFDPTSAAVTVGLPVLAGLHGQATQGKGAAKYKAAKNVRDFEGQATGNADSAFENMKKQQATQGVGETTQAVPEAGPIQQEIAASKQATAQAAQAKVQQADQDRGSLAAMPTGSSDADIAQKAKYLSENAKEKGKWMLLTHGFAPDPDKQELNALLQEKNTAEEQIGWNAFAKGRAEAAEDKINQKLAQVWQRKEDLFGKASGESVKDLYNPKNPGVKRLQQAVDSVTDEANNNILEKVNLKKLVGVQGTDTPSTKSFVSNLIKSDSDTIDSVFEHLSSQKGGDEMVQGVRDAMVQEFFARSVDPQSGKFSGQAAAQLMSGTGDFNVDKLGALFGRGKEGTEGANKFARFVSDLKTLQEVQGSPAGKTSGKLKAFGAVAFPTAILWPLSHGNLKGAAYTAGAEAVTGAAIGYPRLVNKVVNDSGFADWFHKVAASGGDMKVMMASPVFNKWLHGNANSY